MLRHLNSKYSGAAITLTLLAIVGILVAQGGIVRGDAEEENGLAVVWTSGDPDVAHRVALMYTHAAKTQGWFDEVSLIVWGPSQRLLAADKEVQQKVDEMAADGVIVETCIVCAESYGLVERIEELGLEVKGMGAPLSDHIKGDTHVITF
ncbi:MAG: DsrE family protein [Candidatus Hydrogenedentota bacterium]